MDVLIGRQPILDRRNRTVAYELLFRSGGQNSFDGSDGYEASKAVIANCFLGLGSNRVLGSKRGFINFTRALVVGDYAFMLPKNRVVIEVLEDIEPDEEVVEACRKLRDSGYTIALDDIIAANASTPLDAYATYVKLDWLALETKDRRRLCALFRKKGIRLLAEKVETKADFEAALANGCELFQGFYFARPEILSAKRTPTSQIATLRLLNEVQKPELDYERLEELVRADVGLTQKLLCFVNSAAFSRRHTIGSLSQVFVYLGEKNIRKWVTLAALSKAASGKPDELVTTSLTRARFCELAADSSRLKGRSSSCFLLGLLSLLDAMMGRPLDELVDDLGLDTDIADAILGKPAGADGLGPLLNLAVALERSDFDLAERLAVTIGAPIAAAGALHVEAMAWADSLPR